MLHGVHWAQSTADHTDSDTWQFLGVWGAFAGAPYDEYLNAGWTRPVTSFWHSAALPALATALTAPLALELPFHSHTPE